MPKPAKPNSKKHSMRQATDQSTGDTLKLSPPSAPVTALSLTNGKLGVQASLDYVADMVGGRDEFINLCIQANSDSSRAFLAFWRSLPTDERDASTLQDLCTRASMSATSLVGDVAGHLIMHCNNMALLKSAIRRPDVMDANIAIALGDDELAVAAQKIQFQIGGFLKGEGTVINMTQNVQGSGVMSFEDDSHQSTASVKAEGKPVIVPPVEPVPYEADGEVLSVLTDSN